MLSAFYFFHTKIKINISAISGDIDNCNFSMFPQKLHCTFFMCLTQRLLLLICGLSLQKVCHQRKLDVIVLFPHFLIHVNFISLSCPLLERNHLFPPPSAWHFLEAPSSNTSNNIIRNGHAQTSFTTVYVLMYKAT